MADSELTRRVRAGEYVVDAHAVAAAMLRRPAVRELLAPPRRSPEPRRGSEQRRPDHR
jgi:hypothetical protein